MSGALAAIRVLELSGGHASAYAGRVLAGFGASVLTLHLAGDADVTTGDKQTLALNEFLAMNKTHQQIVPEQLPELLADTDVLLVGDDLANIDRWNLNVEALSEAFPTLTITTITPFGRTGPLARRPATELTLQAMSGLLAMSGSSDREPLMRSLQQSKYTAGLNAAYTSLASVYAAADHQEGTIIDLAQREVLASELVLNEATYAYVGAVQGRLPESKDIFFTGAPIRAADGLVTMQVNNRTGVKSFAGLLDEPRLNDDRFSSAEGRLTHSAELTSIVEEALASWEGRAFFEAAAGEGLLAGFVQSAETLLHCPQLEERGVWASLNVGGTEIRVPDQLVRITRFNAERQYSDGEAEVLV